MQEGVLSLMQMPRTTVAVQELRQSLYPLQRLQRILGSWWDFIVTDVTLGTSGNSERMAYLYDRRKGSFTGLAAELTAAGGQAIALQADVADPQAVRQLFDATSSTYTYLLGDRDLVDKALLGLDNARELARELHGKALTALQSLPYNTDILEAFADYIIERTH